MVQSKSKCLHSVKRFTTSKWSEALRGKLTYLILYRIQMNLNDNTNNSLYINESWTFSESYYENLGTIFFIEQTMQSIMVHFINAVALYDGTERGQIAQTHSPAFIDDNSHIFFFTERVVCKVSLLETDKFH